MSKLVYSFTLFLFIQWSANAQTNNYTIYGDLQYDQKDSLFVEIFLADKVDITNILAETSTIEKSFKILDVESKEYLLLIKSLGYKTMIDTILVNQDLFLDYTLIPISEEIQEVTIVGIKDAIQFNHGDINAQVENSVLADRSSINDVLNQLPKLLINPSSNSVSVIGEGRALLYLDNQRITYEQLQAIPVNTIKNIEVIQNPSAKYEADGQVVIVVHRKNDIKDGYDGTLSNMNSIRRGYNNHSSASFSNRKNRLEFQANANYNYQSFWEFFESEIDLRDRGITTDNVGISDGIRNQYIGGAGFYYSLSENEYISSYIQFTTQNSYAPITSESRYNENENVNEYATFSDSKANRYFVSSNLNYNKPVGKGSIFAGIQYTDYLRALNGEINNSINGSASILSQLRDQSFNVSSIAGRVDYSLPVKGGNWEIGINNSYVFADAFTNFQFIETGDQTIRNYKYSEQNLALYSQLSGKKNDFNYRLGLRAEQNKVVGKFEDEIDDFVNRNKIFLFPNANVTYNINSKNSLNLYYRSSIARPNYLNASSISTFITPFLEYSRNANLRSTITHTSGISFQKGNTSIALAGIYRLYPVNSIASFDTVTEIFTLTPENFDREQGFNMDFNTRFSKNDWTSTIFLRGSYTQLLDDRFEEITTRPYLYFYTNQQYLLFKKPNIRIGSVFWALTQRNLNLIKRKPMFSLGFNAQAKINKNWTVSLNILDILNKMEYADTYEINTLLVNTSFYANSRGIELMVSYNFGGDWKSNYKNKDVDENLNRIK